MKEKIKDMIEKYSEEAIFTGTVTDKSIIESSLDELNCSKLSDYKWFLENYGQGGIGGVEILGISKSNKAIFKDITLKYRKLNLPENLIVIENCGEWLYCIDTTTGKIVSWDRLNGIRGERYNTFLDFLIDRFNDEISNL